MSERFYDEEIAPALMTIARRCEENGISFVAIAEWEPGGTGTTRTLQARSGFGIRMVEMITKARGNAGSLIQGSDASRDRTRSLLDSTGTSRRAVLARSGPKGDLGVVRP